MSVACGSWSLWRWLREQFDDVAKMRRMLLTLIIIFVITQIAFFALRYFLTGVPYALAARMHILVLQQFVMIFGSAFIWWNLSPAINFAFTLLNDTSPQPSYKRWQTICAQDILKAVLILLLLLTHLCSIFYFVFIGEEPNLFAMISLTSVAVYIHIIFFLLVFLLMQSVFRLALRLDTSHFSFLRPLVAYELLSRLIAVALAVVLVLAGLWVTLLPPVIRRVTIQIENLPKAQEGFTIALLSDIHIGPTVGRSKVRKIVDATNSLKPDLIAISGDLADGFVRNLDKAASPLKKLTAKYGTYFATGNHEYLHGNVNEWFQFLRKAGILPLHNEHRKVVVGDSVICIAGVDDLYAKESRVPGHAMDYKKALWGCGKNDTTIMLVHQPNAVRVVLKDTEAAQNVDLILAGHTHAGQMYVFVPLVYFANAYFRGLYYEKLTRTHVYVSAGVNYFGPPVKIFGGCEIVFIKLVK